MNYYSKEIAINVRLNDFAKQLHEAYRGKNTIEAQLKIQSKYSNRGKIPLFCGRYNGVYYKGLSRDKILVSMYRKKTLSDSSQNKNRTESFRTILATVTYLVFRVSRLYRSERRRRTTSWGRVSAVSCSVHAERKWAE